MINLPPKTLLIHADLLLTDPPASLAGRWPSMVTVLIRQALERALAQLWMQKAPELVEAPFRVQLLCLGRFVDDEIASTAANTWYELSTACHQRAYELPPTAGELARWYEATEALVREVARTAKSSEA